MDVPEPEPAELPNCTMRLLIDFAYIIQCCILILAVNQGPRICAGLTHFVEYSTSLHRRTTTIKKLYPRIV